MSPSRRAERKTPARLLGHRLLARWPLPEPDGEGDKERRGTVLVVGGSPQMPGGALLAATAALRAGAGKLQVATCRSVAPLIATVLPEAYVLGLPETTGGAIRRSAMKVIAAHAAKAQAVVIGPGMVGDRAIAGWLPGLFARLAKTKAVLVIDAAALALFAKNARACLPLGGRAVLTPHAGEMAMITGMKKSDVLRGPESIARRTAASMGAVIALKGAVTFVASPTGEAFRNEAGNVGLATSGSGDTLSGIVAGLAARGATPLQAAAWGVYLHGCAGDRLARRSGGELGFLARELLDEIPAAMADVTRKGGRRA